MVPEVELPDVFSEEYEELHHAGPIKSNCKMKHRNTDYPIVHNSASPNKRVLRRRCNSDTILLEHISDSFKKPSPPSSRPAFSKVFRGQSVMSRETISKGKFLGNKERFYCGMDKESGHVFAIKTDCRKVALEMELLKLLDHPNIVKYYGHIDSFDVVMEYVSGGSLKSMIDHHGAMNETLTCKFTAHIIRGLHFLHSNGILHGQLKCSNILVSSAGAAKLGSLFEYSQTKFSPDIWTAPEVMRGDILTSASDVWSLGTAVMEMVSGARPWPHIESFAQAIQSIAMRPVPPELPASVPPILKSFLVDCLLRHDPTTRWTANKLKNHFLFIDNNLN